MIKQNNIKCHICTTRRMCERIKVNVLLYTVNFEAFSDIPPSAPWGICEHAILGMDSKFPIWHVHLRLL